MGLSVLRRPFIVEAPQSGPLFWYRKWNEDGSLGIVTLNQIAINLAHEKPQSGLIIDKLIKGNKVRNSI